jgi:hypothetical protein
MSMGRRFLMISEAASSGRSHLAEAHARLFTVGELDPPNSSVARRVQNLAAAISIKVSLALRSKIDLPRSDL